MTYLQIKCLLVILILFSFSSITLGQCDTLCGSNLAPNPSFELTTANCADTISEMFTNYSQVQDWYGIACDTCSGNGSTPDYYNSNCNGPGQTNTCDGSNGSLGFFTFALGAGSDAREYVQAPLNTTLTAGVEYCVSIDAKSATGSMAYDRTDGLGIWFTDQMVDIDVQNGGQQFIGPGSLINASPQVENPAGNIIDTVCQTISGVFTATGTEQWVVIGNFRDDASTTSAGDCSFLCVGYMFVDNISIRTSCNNAPLPVSIQTSSSNDTICEGDCSSLSATVNDGTAPFSVVWDNGVPNGVGPHTVCPNLTTTYTAIVTDSLGDSDTSSVTLYVNPLDTSISNPSICVGDSLFVGGAWQTIAGTYYDTLTNLSNCDSIHITNLIINPIDSSLIFDTICSGDSLFVGGVWQTVAGNYYDTLSNINGCDSIHTTNLVVNPAPSAGTFGSTTLCPTDPATDLFNQLSGSPDNGGTWTGPSALANGDQGTFDPATNTAGTYLYTVTNSCGTDTASVTVTISTNPVPGTNGTASLCSNASSVNLLDSLGGTPSSGGSWSGPSGLTGGDLGTFDPATNTAGTYTYTVNDCSGSPQTADVIVTITPGPDAGINGSITLCNTDPATDLFNQLGGTPDAGGSWSPAMNSGTGVFDPAIDAAGTYTYTVTNSCGSISADVIVTVTTCTTPTASYTVSDSAVCAGECITYTDASSGATSWQWTFNGGNPSSATGAGPHTVCYGTDGTYNVELIVSNSNGSDTTSSTVTIHPTPTVNAGDDVTIDLGESTVLDATGTNGTYSWTPPTDLSCNPCPNPTASPSETVTYTVIVVDSNGCTASDDVTVIVDFDYVIWVPNIFSPNGDGNNDVVYVRGVGVADLKFFIYDRWGEKVFETTDLDIGWDGTFRGSKMNNAVFVYYLEATFLDGTAVTKKGDITLVR